MTEPVNPWTWQERFGYSQAWRVDGAESLVVVAGQGPIAADGSLVGAGDFEAQARRTFENLRTVLEAAGTSFAGLVSTTTYLTDVTRARDLGRVRAEFVTGPPPAGTVVGVTGLAVPGMMLEISAIAVR
ncbi:RidA family protein [Petropleomorpha daqingensis]|uniref:Enamine deaminase RidA (YjgF/YER057c/UK114 family) n=1 Tax=Petropleomorpha daqingensis TaxID=2026353 RepID=A0A853CM44_9ACTN|nr:RidA family protein [Petropleomorpha daqingensis]NYJ07328.1 enamine deaminase RidA (YjgF/YER057c/UK114 family) [Petropleomorpha daqingensis]